MPNVYRVSWIAKIPGRDLRFFNHQPEATAFADSLPMPKPTEAILVERLTWDDISAILNGEPWVKRGTIVYRRSGRNPRIA